MILQGNHRYFTTSAKQTESECAMLQSFIIVYLSQRLMGSYSIHLFMTFFVSYRMNMTPSESHHYPSYFYDIFIKIKTKCKLQSAVLVYLPTLTSTPRGLWFIQGDGGCCTHETNFDFLSNYTIPIFSYLPTRNNSIIPCKD